MVVLATLGGRRACACLAASQGAGGCERADRGASLIQAACLPRFLPSSLMNWLPEARPPCSSSGGGGGSGLVVGGCEAGQRQAATAMATSSSSSATRLHALLRLRYASAAAACLRGAVASCRAVSAGRPVGGDAAALSSSSFSSSSSVEPPPPLAAEGGPSDSPGARRSIPSAPPPLPADRPSVTNPPPPPTPNESQRRWSDSVWASPLNIKRRIFCNRSLDMGSIRAVGFDMDYTLAQYRSDSFESLAHAETVKQLVSTFGYPAVLREFVFDWRYMMRGLIIDKRRGNVVKVDRHKYVKIAYHGFRALTRQERVSTYSRSQVSDSFDEPKYAMIDTLFSLAEAHLFMSLVELKDAAPELLPPGKDYAEMYRDVRAAVDLCHRDGSLKRAVASNPGRYIHRDPCLTDVLDLFKAEGKKIFLATNSLWDYTNVAMNFLVDGRVGGERNLDWLGRFDAVLTGCGKPGFFSDRKPLFAVDPGTGMLRNTDNGAPTIPIGEEDLPSLSVASTAPDLEGRGIGDVKGKVFQGGNYVDLHKMLGVESGSEVLYVGDHIYGDILRSKKSLGWRTMLVVPELESELEILSKCKGVQEKLKALRQERDALDDQIHRLEWNLRRSPDQGSVEHEEEPKKYQTMIEDLKSQRENVKLQHRTILREHHNAFHPVWGRLLKTGYQNSRLAHQIERFACLYTSHVGNLIFYSPQKSYRGRLDCMAHEEDPCLGLLQDDLEESHISSNGTGL